MAAHLRCYVPVFVELYGEATHLLHGAVGEGELHEGLVRLPAEGAGDLEPLTLLCRQPNLQHSSTIISTSPHISQYILPLLAI